MKNVILLGAFISIMLAAIALKMATNTTDTATPVTDTTIPEFYTGNNWSIINDSTIVISGKTIYVDQMYFRTGQQGVVDVSDKPEQPSWLVYYADNTKMIRLTKERVEFLK